MALTSTQFPAPFPMQLSTIQFGQEPLYRLLDALANEGVVAADDLKVSQRAAGANLSVDVAVGDAFVGIESAGYGGKRYCRNQAISNSGTPGSASAPDWASTFTTPDAGNPRVDRVVLTARDSSIDGAGAYDCVLRVIAGTATAGATLANLTGAAAVPANSLLLANVLLGAGATTIPDANIDTLGDGYKRVRPRAFERDVLCRVSRAATQSLATSGTAAAITWDQEDVDLDSMWAAGDATRIFARTPGYYIVEGFVRFAFNATSTRQVEVKNEAGTSLCKAAVQTPATTDEAAVAFTTGPVLLGTASNTRYVTVEAMQRSGGALNVTGATVTARLVKAA